MRISDWSSDVCSSDLLCYAIDHQGLTRDAHRTFYTHYCPLINRLVAGPQKERHEELIALIKSGTVHILPGYNATNSYNSATRKHTITLRKPEPQHLLFDQLVNANVSAQDSQRHLYALLNDVTERTAEFRSEEHTSELQS